MNDIAARFGENVSRLRKAAGLSQEDLALRASLHRTEVSQVECGKRLVRIDTLIKLAGSLGVSSDELLDGLQWKPGERVYGRFRLAGGAEG